MSIIPTDVHPTWCTPHTCQSDLHADGAVGYEHREPAPILRSYAHPDVDITITRTRLDDFGIVPSISPVRTALRLLDTSSLVGGKHAQIDRDLSAADARLLAAALVYSAEQVEAVNR